VEVLCAVPGLGGKAMVVFNVQGTQLTSKAAADNLCEYVGTTTHRISGFRMAEFHDGDQSAGRAGWDFWADGLYTLDPIIGCIPDHRFWVSINDQPANPWS
jgi:hypothetical protein